ncbi:3-oxoacyl-ACP synthase, partial [Burkholderia cepacia]|nr:3-oxoacyl-ACP synthase [Burkholderia cepacia]
MTLTAFIESIGLVGPGLSGWPHAADVLAGRAPYAPARTELPPP